MFTKPFLSDHSCKRLDAGRYVVQGFGSVVLHQIRLCSASSSVPSSVQFCIVSLRPRTIQAKLFLYWIRGNYESLSRTFRDLPGFPDHTKYHVSTLVCYNSFVLQTQLRVLVDRDHCHNESKSGRFYCFPKCLLIQKRHPRVVLHHERVVVLLPEF